jgi:O-antigen/teichoic acid export membrane protein
MKRQIAVVASVAIKIVSGLLTIGFAARWLDSTEFIFFVQFGFLLALGNLLATGGVIHGVVRGMAGGADEDRVAIVGTALAVSASIGLVTLIVAAVFSGNISRLLVGSDRWWWMVVALVPLTLFAGQGQIVGAYLTGLGHSIDNLMIQNLALLLATIGTVFGLYSGDPVAATLAFAGGLALQAPLMLIWVKLRGLYHPHILARVSRAHGRELLRYCFAFIVTATAMPLALFVLRDDYRHSFGVALLAGWLAANRLSDVFTQLLGVYMGQIYLPERAQVLRDANRPRWLRGYTQHLAIAGATMLGGVAAFLLAPQFWIRLGLGEAMLPAVAIITLYLIGDVLRSWPSINLHSLLAAGATRTYAAVELLTVGLFVALFFAFKSIAGSMAPAVAYIANNLLIGLIGFVILWRTERLRRGAVEHNIS